MVRNVQALEQVIDSLIDRPRHRFGQSLGSFSQVRRLTAPTAVAVATVFLGGAGGLVVGSASAAFANVDERRIASTWTDRAAIQLVDAGGRWIGSVALTDGRKRTEDAFTIPSEPPPYHLRQAVLALEDRRFFESNLCGISWLSSAARIVRSGGTAGGSGIHQQLSKTLELGGEESGVLERIARKVREVGVSCRLAGILARSEALELYLASAPFLQGPGTVRGAEAASRILFARPLQTTTAAQQLILAAAVKRPVSIPHAHDSRIPCDAVELPVRRRNWCRTIARARVAARLVLDPRQQQTVIAQLNAAETQGPTFEGMPIRGQLDPALWNSVTRPTVMLPGGVVAEIRAEIGKRPPTNAEPVRVSVSAERQSAMTTKVRDALKQVESGTCVPLIERAGKTCVAGGSGEGAVLAVSMKATGEINALYKSGLVGLDSRIQLGSVAKLAGVLALTRAGASPEDKFCPRRVKVDGRLVRRAVADDEHGVDGSQCANAMLSLEGIVAKSDNLAFLDALRQFTSTADLRRAAEDIGFDVPVGEDPAYALTFGTATATPRAVLAGMARLASAAWGERIGPPRIVVSPDAPSTTAQLVTEDKVGTLRHLLAAPVKSGGTLAGLPFATGGKTGTVTVTRGGLIQDRGKIATWFEKNSKTVKFAVVVSSDGGPLARSLPWRQIQPILRQI